MLYQHENVTYLMKKGTCSQPLSMHVYAHTNTQAQTQRDSEKEYFY